MTALAPGLRGRAVLPSVQDADLASSLGSGDVPVLGTPRVLALAEEATVAALADVLPADRTSVGTAVRLRHLAPTPPGASVEATAELAACEGRRLRFRVEVRDPGGLVADGEIERVVVDRASFVDGARSRLRPASGDA